MDLSTIIILAVGAAAVIGVSAALAAIIFD